MGQHLHALLSYYERPLFELRTKAKKYVLSFYNTFQIYNADESMTVRFSEIDKEHVQRDSFLLRQLL